MCACYSESFPVILSDRKVLLHRKNKTMKKITLLLALAAIAAASCQKPEAAFPVSEQFTATVESFDSQTKTSMTPEKAVVWSENDRIAIFQGATVAYEYKVKDECAGTTNGTFDLVHDGEHAVGNDFLGNVAFYPYSDGLSLTAVDDGNDESAYQIKGVGLDVVQKYVAGSFADDKFLMAAITGSISDHNLKFKNVLGAIRLQLIGTETVKSLTITGGNDEILSGSAVVTVYQDGAAPVIEMTGSDEVSKSVTLDCGEGVQLNEDAATHFIIALPPVQFENGFTVIVTDTDNREYVLNAGVTNTVFRSSVLTMPVAGLGDPLPEETVEVSSISVDKSSLTMAPGTSYTYSVEFDPTDATDKTLIWTSSDENVAEVNNQGRVTALAAGEATITVSAAGGVTSVSAVKVVAVAEATKDYVDEYGQNHGKGIAIGSTVWAPVNCGYKSAVVVGDAITDNGYPYGKLYQWGRKYGQGYSGELVALDGTAAGSVEDKDYQAGEKIVAGPVAAEVANDEVNADVFYTSSNTDWSNIKNNNYWRDQDGNKTIADPCPSGWRVPTASELYSLDKTKSSWMQNEEGLNGYYFSGEYTQIEGAPMIFLPAAGGRSSGGDANGRGKTGYYWSSQVSNANQESIPRAQDLVFKNGEVIERSNGRASGYSVRCVQE